MPAGCRSRSSWPLTGRTAARSASGQPADRAGPASGGHARPAAEPMSSPSASRTPRARPSLVSTSLTRSRTNRTLASRAASRSAAAYRRLSTDQSPANSTPPCTSGVRKDSSLRQARLSSSSASRPDGPAEGRQPHQRGVVPRVVGDRERPLAAQPDLMAGRVLQLGRERAEPADREQVEPEQRALAEQGLRGGREHARGDQRRRVTAGRDRPGRHQARPPRPARRSRSR